MTVYHDWKSNCLHFQWNGKMINIWTTKRSCSSMQVFEFQRYLFGLPSMCCDVECLHNKRIFRFASVPFTFSNRWTCIGTLWFIRANFANVFKFFTYAVAGFICNTESYTYSKSIQWRWNGISAAKKPLCDHLSFDE